LATRLANDISLCTVREVKAIIELSKQIYLKKSIQEIIDAVEGVREILEAIMKVTNQLGGRTDKDKLAGGLKGLKNCISVVYDVPLPDPARDIKTISKEYLKCIIKMGKSPPTEMSQLYQEVTAACADMAAIVDATIRAYENIKENETLKETMDKINECTRKLKSFIGTGKPLSEITEVLSPAVKKLVDLAEDVYEPMSSIKPPSK